MAATHTHNVDRRRADPTGTKTLREREFVPAIRKRFRTLRGLLRSAVGREVDALRLSANAEPPQPFDFPTDAGKEAAFARWLQTAIDEEVLEPVGDLGIRNGEHYTGRFIRGSYSKGVGDADRRLRNAGIAVEETNVAAALNLPVHKATLRRLYSRSFGNLEGITDDTATIIREQLTQGLAEGINPNEMARRLTKEVRTIERTRGVVLARTETINAYSEATLQRYDQMGVGEVTVEAEWLTAGDNRVCPICESLEGQTFTTQQARTETFLFEAGEEQPASLSGDYSLKPPAHPQCRCSLLPSVS